MPPPRVINTTLTAVPVRHGGASRARHDWRPGASRQCAQRHLDNNWPFGESTRTLQQSDFFRLRVDPRIFSDNYISNSWLILNLSLKKWACQTWTQCKYVIWSMSEVWMIECHIDDILSLDSSMANWLAGTKWMNLWTYCEDQYGPILLDKNKFRS